MTMDPISDMLTTIRNGLKARLHSVATPASSLKGEIARVMKEAGYIADAVTTSEFPKKLVITLKYSDHAVPAITEIKRISMKLDENERGNTTRLMKLKDLILVDR